ncbi:MAG: hypothetical protein ABI183_25805 [Polyangiaceae bacterium]
MHRPFFMFALLASGLVSCSSCSHKSSGDDLGVPVVLSPVAAPDNLVAEITINNPDFFWGHLQHGVGGLAALLPQSLGGLVTSLGSVDPSLAPAVDGSSPAYAGIITRGADEFGWAVAVTLTDLPHARATLIDGESAHYDGKEEGIWTVLTRKGGASPASPGPQIAISKNGMLVVADTADDVKAVGEYLTRTMPTHPRLATDVAIDVPRAALGGALHDRLSAAWTNFKTEKQLQADEAKKTHGRAADFGDPSGILALADGVVQKRLALMIDLQNAHISIDSDATSVTVDALLTPNEGNGAASQWVNGLKVGEATPVLDMAAGPLTILSRSSDADRAAAPTDFEAALKGALGNHLNDADAKLARAAATDWNAGLGDYVTISVSTDGVPGANVVTPTGHPDPIQKSIHEGFELLARPAFAEPLASNFNVNGSSFGMAEIKGVGNATTFTLKRGAGTPLGAAWILHDGSFELGLSPDPIAFLISAAHPEHVWRADPTIVARSTALGSTVSFAAVSHPFPSSDPNASLFFAWGRDGTKGRASVATSDVVLREAIRLLGR